MSRRLKRSLLILFVAATLGAMALWQLSRARPAWYAPPDRHDVRAAALAEKIEYAVLEESHKLRAEDQPWSVVVRDEQINAWLATRLPQWASHEESLKWLADQSTLQVRTDKQGISLAMAGPEDERDRVFVARFLPRLEHGRLSVTVDRVWLGRLSLPGAPLETVLSRLAAWAPQEFLDQPAVRSTIELLFSESDDSGVDPVLTLDDGRRVRLLDLKCAEGQVLLKCATLPAE